MRASTDAVGWYQRMLAASFLSGFGLTLAFVLVLRDPVGYLQRSPVEFLTKAVCSGLLGMLSGSFVGLGLKAFVFRGSPSPYAWGFMIGVPIGVSLTTAGLLGAVTFPWR